uniref:Uncharacterized protein n=1 Tax=Macrostomum lignano TaxID=282301 RepID=A0A1I8GJ37_9PLAT
MRRQRRTCRSFSDDGASRACSRGVCCWRVGAIAPHQPALGRLRRANCPRRSWRGGSGGLLT